MPHESISIQNPAHLHIADGSWASFGANQSWYRGWIKQLSGCGPTAASNLMWYLACTRPSLRERLWPESCMTRDGMLRLMNQMWHYVTPGMRGVDDPRTLAEGVRRFGMERGVALSAPMLPVSREPALRPSEAQVQDFLAEAFRRDGPVAFLNLSNGRVYTLDNWHWVTLVSVDGALQAQMYDQGRQKPLDLALWLETTGMGGGFVALDAAEG